MLFFLAALRYNLKNFFFLGAFLAMFIGSCVQSTQHTRVANGPIPTDQVHLERLMNATVGFVMEEQGKVNSPPFCTGFYVSHDTIISAAHCFREAVRLEVGGRTLTLRSPLSIVGQRVSFILKSEYDNSDSLREVDVHFGTIVRTDFDHDILAISTNDVSSMHIPIANTLPGIGEKVYGIGHPSGMGWTFSEGIVARTLVRFNRLLVVQATTLLAGGCSGGPLLNGNGEVIGVADAFVNNLPHLGIFIGSHYISAISNEETIQPVPAPRILRRARDDSRGQY
jgi:hypothetical protein